MEPTCPRCGEPSEGLCAPCAGYVLRFDPYALRPGIPGPSVDQEVRRGVALLSLDPKAPVRFAESPPKREGEAFQQQFLRLVRPANRGAVVLTRGDRETLHRILRTWVTAPPRSEDVRAMARDLYAEAASLPDMPPTIARQLQFLASPPERPPTPIIPEVSSLIPTVQPSEPQIIEAIPEETFSEPEAAPLPVDSMIPIEPIESVEAAASPQIPPAAESPMEKPATPVDQPNGLGEREDLTSWMEEQHAEVERRRERVRYQLDELQRREEEIAAREQRIRDEELRQSERDKELQRRAQERPPPEVTRTLYLLLFSLEGLSRETASAIADAFWTVDRLRAAAVEDIAAVPGVLPEEAALVRDVFSKGVPVRRDLREKAEDLLEEQRFEQALEVFDAMVAENPRDVEAWFNRSEVLTLLGRDDEASASLDRALEIEPTHKGSLRELTNLLFERGDFGLAAAHLNDLLKLAPDEAQHWLRRAGELLTEGKATEATLVYNSILEYDPKNLPASLALGDLLLAMDDVERADRTYSRVLQYHPDSPEALLKKGLLLNRQGRWGAAIQMFNRAVSLRFDYPEAWAAKAQVLLARGKPKEALEAFDRLISLDDTQHGAWLGKAQALLALGQAESAAHAARKVLLLNEGNAEALAILNPRPAVAVPAPKAETRTRERIDTGVLLEMADSFLEAGDGEAALQGYEEVLHAEPGEAKALFGKGRALHMLDRYEEALHYFSEAVKAAPNEEEYVRWRKRGEERVRKEGAG